MHDKTRLGAKVHFKGIFFFFLSKKIEYIFFVYKLEIVASKEVFILFRRDKKIMLIQEQGKEMECIFLFLSSLQSLF